MPPRSGRARTTCAPGPSSSSIHRTTVLNDRIAHAALPLGHRVMVVTDDARHLPRAVLESPEVNESTLAERLGVIVAGMVKTMDADLQGAPVLDGIDLEARRNQ